MPAQQSTATAPDLSGLLTPEFLSGDPYPTFAWLRESSPVHWHAPLGVWVVTRHAEVSAVSRDIETFSVSVRGTRLRDLGGQRHFYQGARGLFQTDPPEHPAYRAMVNRAFSPRVVKALEQQVHDVADELCRQLEPEDDFVARVAEPLPIWVIAETLGLPRADWDQFRHWTDTRVREMDAAPGSDEDRSIRAELDDYFEYLRALLEHRRGHPADDLASVIAAAELSLPDQVQMLNSMIVGGNETTRASMSSAVVHLSHDATAWDALQADPEDVARSGTEEVLRHFSPIINFGRTATRDVDLGGQLVREGDFVVMMYGSANRDSQIWTDSEEFDIARPPRPHLTFGTGSHVCVGAPLARLEIRVLLEVLAAQFARLEPSAPPVRLVSNHVNQYVSVPTRTVRR